MKLIKFSSTWCSPCKVMAALMKHNNIYDKFEHVDVDENAELVAQYKIRGVPTIILADDDGNVVRSISGNATVEQLQVFVDYSEMTPSWVKFFDECIKGGKKGFAIPSEYKRDNEEHGKLMYAKAIELGWIK